MSKVDQKTKKQLSVNTFSHASQASSQVPARPNYQPPATKQNLPPALPDHTREVAPIEPEYADLLKPKESPLKHHLLPVAAIVVFSLVLVVIFHMTKPAAQEPGRNVSSDYEEEKICHDLGDGTQSCTTRTKVRKSIRN
jgi:hypothetical protein